MSEYKYKIGDTVKVLCDEGQPLAKVVYVSTQSELDYGECEYFISHSGMVGPFEDFEDCLHYELPDGDCLGLVNGYDLEISAPCYVDDLISEKASTKIFDDDALTLAIALFK